MTKQADNARFYGDLASGVWVAPKGTTFPVDLAAPSGTWDEVGWLQEDGIPFERDTDSTELKAYQGSKLIRRRVTTNGEKLTFASLEENLPTLQLAFPGAEITEDDDITRLVPSGAASSEWACLVDVIDGDIIKRYEVIRGDIALTGTVDHKDTDATVHTFELTMYEYELVSNNPAWQAA